MRAPRCRLIDSVTRDACGKPACVVVEFPDGERAWACEACAMVMVELARSHGCVLKVEVAHEYSE